MLDGRAEEHAHAAGGTDGTPGRDRHQRLRVRGDGSAGPQTHTAGRDVLVPGGGHLPKPGLRPRRLRSAEHCRHGQFRKRRDCAQPAQSQRSRRSRVATRHEPRQPPWPDPAGQQQYQTRSRALQDLGFRSHRHHPARRLLRPRPGPRTTRPHRRHRLRHAPAGRGRPRPARRAQHPGRRDADGVPGGAERPAAPDRPQPEHHGRRPSGHRRNPQAPLRPHRPGAGVERRAAPRPGHRSTSCRRNARP